jgi:hypothetical protein
MLDPDLLAYARETSAHECGHMVVMFKESKLVDLRFLPHETAADGIKGVFEANRGTELVEEDCVALAAGMAGELIYFGKTIPERSLDDRQHVQRLSGKALDDFLPDAQDIIKQNSRFFSLLNVEVKNRITDLLLKLRRLDWETLPSEIEIISLAEVRQIYERAESDKSEPR